MNEMLNISGDGKRILFFGRAKCDASAELLDKLIRYSFDVTYVKSQVRGEKLPEDILLWEGDYIICYRSLYILPKALLNKVKIAAINFHPAPPEYPGSGCINFALYDEVREYGVTAHIMNEVLDNGEILEVRLFPVTPCDDLPSILARTHKELSNLCSDFISGIHTEGDQIIKRKLAYSNKESWNGKARLLKELEDLQKINLNISKDTLKRIVRATNIEGHPPMIELHGFKFYLKLDNKRIKAFK